MSRDKKQHNNKKSPERITRKESPETHDVVVDHRQWTMLSYNKSSTVSQTDGNDCNVRRDRQSVSVFAATTRLAAKWHKSLESSGRRKKKAMSADDGWMIKKTLRLFFVVVIHPSTRYYDRLIDCTAVSVVKCQHVMTRVYFTISGEESKNEQIWRPPSLVLLA